MTDGHLLERFLARRDQAAFAELVRRHGPMVLGVCRRAAASEQDAEDAFQATFLVLVRKAASVVPRDRVGNWLFGVACRTSRKVHAAATKQRAKEKQVKVMPEPLLETKEDVTELAYLLDQELERLPEKYRVPVVLCELEGKPRKEVARQLRLPEGTLSSRLATARRMLATRLRRRGLALTGAAVAIALAQNAAGGAVAPALADSMVKTAALAAAGQSVTGAVSAQAAAIAEGLLKAMLVAKLRALAAGLLVLVVLGVAAVGWRQNPRAEDHSESLSAAPCPVQGPAPPANQSGLERPITVFLVNAAGEASTASLVAQAPMTRTTATAPQVSISLSFTTSPDPPEAELVLSPSPQASYPQRLPASRANEDWPSAGTASAVELDAPFFHPGECDNEEFRSAARAVVRLPRGRSGTRRRSRLLAAEQPGADDIGSFTR